MTIKSVEEITFYFGKHDKDGRPFVTVNDDPLPLHHEIAKRADSFEWGNLGAGAQQLAVALLADALGEKAAHAYADHFYTDVVIRLHEQGWGLTNMGIRWWLENIMEDKAQS